MRRSPVLVLAGLAVTAGLLSGCVPEPGPTASSAVSNTPGLPAAASPSGSPTPTTTPIALPKDCRAILSPAVLAQLANTPLNDPSFGADTGVQPDGSLHCIWGRPDTDTDRLRTEISRMDRGPALDLMNQLQKDSGFTCFTPDGGTRCEKTWPDSVYPVTDGRTLFWRDGVMIDTRYSSLAPEGYTSSVVAALWG